MSTTSEAKRAGRGRALTLLVASLSAAGAAIVVHDLWRPGTIVSAALSPVLLSLFDELLHRPLDRLEEVVRAHLSGRQLPSLAQRAASVRGDSDRWRRAVMTGLVAFVIGGIGLTVVELLLHHSLGNRSDQTTLLGGSVHHLPPAPAREQTTAPVRRSLTTPKASWRPRRVRHAPARPHTTTVILPKLAASTTSTTTGTTTATVTTVTSTPPGGAATTTTTTTP